MNMAKLYWHHWGRGRREMFPASIFPNPHHPSVISFTQKERALQKGIDLLFDLVIYLEFIMQIPLFTLISSVSPQMSTGLSKRLIFHCNP